MDTEERARFGARVRQARKDAGRSQAEVAAAAGIAPNTLLGVPLHTVADILGHADMALTLSRYTRSNLDSQRAALASLPPLPARPALGNA